MTPRMRVRLKRYAVLASAVAVVVGAGVARHRAGEAVLSDTITRPAPELGVGAQALLPKLTDAVVVVPDRPHDPDEVHSAARRAKIKRTRSFEVSTNDVGLRGPALRDPPGEPRVLCLGDSVTFGWGVSEADSWPRGLERMLRETFPDVEVINAGVPARTPDVMAAWLEAEGADLAPDLVLFVRRPDPRVEDPIGAYVDAVRRAQTAVSAPLWVILPPVSRFDPDGLDRGDLERSALMGSLGATPVLGLTPAFRIAARGRAVSGAVDLERGKGVQRLVRDPSGEVLLEATAPEHGLAPEIMAAFEADLGLVEPLFFDGGHPDAAGYEVFAATVLNGLRARGWPPTTPPASGAPPG